MSLVSNDICGRRFRDIQQATLPKFHQEKNDLPVVGVVFAL